LSELSGIHNLIPYLHSLTIESEAIMAGNLTEVTNDTFESEVKQSDVPVLVDFWAPWCGPCRALAPILEQVAEEMEGKVKIVKLNTDEQAETAQSFNIMSIPTMILFVDGEVKDQISGARPKDAIVQALNKHLAPA
jgi:thioredoxin 1